MHLRIIVWLTIILLPCAAWAESSVWRVRTAQGALYLAGSIHVLREQDYPLPPEFEAAYADAQVLVLEAELDAAAQAEAQQAILTRGLYGEGDSIRRHLSPALYTRLEQYCAAHHLSLTQLERLKPWLLVMTLTVAEMRAEGFDAAAGLDQHLAGRAARDGKATHGLETLEDQINALAAFDGEADPLVANFLTEAETVPQTMEEMVRAWRSGDGAALDGLLSREMRAQYPALYQSLLVNRNRRWMEGLESWARSGQRVLVVVGAAHLVGEEGVVNLLQKRGYRVEKLALPARP